MSMTAKITVTEVRELLCSRMPRSASSRVGFGRDEGSLLSDVFIWNLSELYCQVVK